jgi:hypothetical protein
MGLKRSQAVEFGIALGLIIGLALVVAPLGRDDFSRFFWPVGRGANPYGPGTFFWYPVWNVLVLRLACLLPRVACLVLIWALNVGVVLWVSRAWDTPAWVTLVSPPFVWAMLLGHPWEAVVLAGLTLALRGWQRGQGWMVGLGLALMLFKPQIGVWPGLLIVLALSGSREGQGRKWLLVPAGLVIASTVADFAISGRWWMISLWQELPFMGQGENIINHSLTVTFGWANLLWLPVVGWLLWQLRARFVGDSRRELWVAVAVGFLLGPYWSAYSLWPLVTMAGCWLKNKGGAAWNNGS